MHSIPRIPAEQVFELIETNAGLLLLTFLVPTLPIADVSRRDLQAVAPEFVGLVDFGEVDVHPGSDVIDALSLASIPTLLLFHDSNEVERVERAWTPATLSEYLAIATSFYDGPKD